MLKFIVRGFKSRAYLYGWNIEEGVCTQSARIYSSGGNYIGGSFDKKVAEHICDCVNTMYAIREAVPGITNEEILERIKSWK